MSLGRPRRIFRSAIPPLEAKAILVTLAGIAAIGSIVGLTVLVRPAAKSAHTAAVTEELDAAPAQVAVVDAGTLRLRDRVVRLSGVQPPARGEQCSAGRDCGAAATDALAAMVRETPVACQLSGEDRMGRPYAVCQASGTQLNQAVIAAGWARADSTEPMLREAEATARAQRRGVWASGNGSW